MVARARAADRYLLPILACAITGCAHPDLTRPVDTSLGLTLGIYQQQGEVVSRWQLAEALEKDFTVQDRISGHRPWTTVSVLCLLTGAITGGTALAMNADPRRNDEAPLVVGITALSILATGLIADLVARVYLDDALEAHNLQLRPIQRRRVGRSKKDPRPELEPGRPEAGF